MRKWIILTYTLLMITTPSLAADDESGGSTNMNQKQVSPAHEMFEGISSQTASPMGAYGEETVSEKTKEEPGHGFGHKLLLYIPNRILDIFDFIRLRGRVGPGLAAGVRATRPLTVSVGGYSSIYVGLPGPRQKPAVKLPVGIENYAGMEISLLDGSNKGKFSPNYSSTEIGVSVHPLLIGIDFCIDPLEVIDLALGFVFIDVRGDDF